MSQTDRLFDSNDSFAEGRQTELVVIRTLERAGLIVTGTKANQPHYDIVIIDPVQDKEFIAQIKSSKHRKPYITCRNFYGLIETANKMRTTPLIVLSFTTQRQFVIIEALTNKVLFSTHTDPEYQVGGTCHFQCYDKEK